MGKAWFDEVATRSESYSGTWNFWVEGPNGQARFDHLVLDAVSMYPTVLDCGCGDGAFTVRVAQKAARVVGVDFSPRMIERARAYTNAHGVTNVHYVIVSHVREGNPFRPNSFDFAYSRRGPHILTVIPALVRPGGMLMAIHPEDVPAAYYAEAIARAGLEVILSERCEDIFHFPTLDDLAEHLSRQPGIPDVRQPEHRSLLLEKANTYSTQRGDYAVCRPYLVWAARRPLAHGAVTSW